MPTPSLPAWHESPLLRAARREPDGAHADLADAPGRPLPAGISRLRRKLGFLELCQTPDLCAEIMLATVDRLGVDAAILFSDLLLILEPMGLRLEFTAGEGPRLRRSVAAGGGRRSPAGAGERRALGVRAGGGAARRGPACPRPCR